MKTSLDFSNHLGTQDYKSLKKTKPLRKMRFSTQSIIKRILGWYFVD